MVKIVVHWGLSCLTKKHLGGDRRLVTVSGSRVWPGGIEDTNVGAHKGAWGIASKYAMMEEVAIDRWPELQFFGR